MGGVITGSGATGQANIYAQIRNRTTGQLANGVGMEAYNQAHWTSYAITTPEQAGSGEYVLTLPGYVPDGNYKATYYIPLNGTSPLSGDTPFSTEEFDVVGGNVIGVGSPLNVGQINGSAQAAINLAAASATGVIGAAVAGTLSTTQMTTNLAASVANVYAGRILYFTSGVNAGFAVLITAYVVSGGKLTFIAYNNLPLPSAPSAADTFIII